MRTEGGKLSSGTLGLLNQCQTEYGSRPPVGTGTRRLKTGSGPRRHPESRSAEYGQVAQQRLGQFGRRYKASAERSFNAFMAGPGFCLDPILFAPRQNQNASLDPSVLDGDHQQCFNQALENDLPRDSLGCLHHCLQVQLLNRRAEGASRVGDQFPFAEVWIEFIELPHLASGFPT